MDRDLASWGNVVSAETRDDSRRCRGGGSQETACAKAQRWEKKTHSRKGRKGMCWCRVICRRHARGQGPNLTPGSQLPGSLYPISVPHNHACSFFFPYSLPLQINACPWVPGTAPGLTIPYVQCNAEAQFRLTWDLPTSLPRRHPPPAPHVHTTATIRGSLLALSAPMMQSNRTQTQ